jgi:hypothetical protein
MQVFGHAPSSEMNTFNYLNDLYIELRDQHELLIISEEVGKAKPATLFFLSKFGCLLEKVVFYSKVTKTSIWDQIDILLTANNDLLLDYPIGKTIIKYETDYNKQIDIPLTIKSLEEFSPLMKNILK